jgi:hypothetical protein
MRGEDSSRDTDLAIEGSWRAVKTAGAFAERSGMVSAGMVASNPRGWDDLWDYYACLWRRVR